MNFKKGDRAALTAEYMAIYLSSPSAGQEEGIVYLVEPLNSRNRKNFPKSNEYVYIETIKYGSIGAPDQFVCPCQDQTMIDPEFSLEELELAESFLEGK